MVAPLPFCLHSFSALLCDVALLQTIGSQPVSALGFQDCCRSVGFLFCFVCLIMQEGRDISVSGSVSVRDKAE